MNYKNTFEEEFLYQKLSQKIGIREINVLSHRVNISVSNIILIWKLSFSSERRVSINSLWILTHIKDLNRLNHSINFQDEIISRLLLEDDTSKKRLFLQIIKKLTLNVNDKLTVELLNYCFSKINSECEPYAVRCNCIYIAYDLCIEYPELIKELEEHLNLLSLQSLSPGLLSALRQIRRKIVMLRRLESRRLK